MLDTETILFRFALAAVLGGIIGLEREAHGRSAGLRTNIMVTTGTALMMMVSLHMFELYKGYSDSSVIRLDPGRIASYAISGMGFIGAGVIIKGRGSVRGITTASCLWMLTAVGLAIGCGYYDAGLAATLLSIVTLVIFDYLKQFINRNLYTEMVIRSVDKEGQLADIKTLLEKYKARVLFVGFSKEVTQGLITFFFHIRMREKENWAGLAAELSGLSGLKEIEWKEGYVP